MRSFLPELREGLREPRPQREHARSCGEGLAGPQAQRVQPPSRAFADLRMGRGDPASGALEDPRHRLDCATGADHAGVRLVQRHGYLRQVDHRPSAAHFVGVQDLVADPGLFPVAASLFQEVVPLLPEDQVGGGEEDAREEHLLPLGVPFGPLLNRALGPARPEEAVFAAAVARAHAPGLAAGSGAGVGRSVLVDQHDLRAGLLKVKGRPGAEGSCAYHRHVGGLAGVHGGGGPRVGGGRLVGGRRRIGGSGRWVGRAGRRVRAGAAVVRSEGGRGDQNGASPRPGRLQEPATVRLRPPTVGPGVPRASHVVPRISRWNRTGPCEPVAWGSRVASPPARRRGRSSA